MSQKQLALLEKTLTGIRKLQGALPRMLTLRLWVVPSACRVSALSSKVKTLSHVM